MKKTLVSIACALLCTFTASAQRASSSSFFSTEKESTPVTLGLRGGLNISNFGGDALDIDSKLGFNAGVNVDIPIVKSFGIQTGLFYTSKGAKQSAENNDNDAEVKVNEAYLQIPVLASYRYYIKDDVRWEFNAGPYLAFGVGGKLKESWNNISTESDWFDDDISSFDMGVALGTGITVNKIYFGIQYEIGMYNMLKDSETSLKNTNFSVNVGYNF